MRMRNECYAINSCVNSLSPLVAIHIISLVLFGSEGNGFAGSLVLVRTLATAPK